MYHGEVVTEEVTEEVREGVREGVREELREEVTEEERLQRFGKVSLLISYYIIITRNVKTFSAFCLPHI